MATFPSSQLEALSDLYYATNGSNWIFWNCDNSSVWAFEEGANPCTENWCGITCYTDISSVKGLNLDSNNLSGTIPESISQLVDLETLDLGGDQIYGTIPSSIGLMRKLKLLSLSYCDFEGSLPDIFSEESNLQFLDLSYNALEGTVPISFKKLKDILIINLSNNKLYGKLTDWMTPKQLNQIITLDLRTNMFSGSIPSETNLTSMKGLYLSSNNFDKTIPDIFYHATNFSFLFLSNNFLIGTLPSSITNSKVSYLLVDDNLLDGKINTYDWSVMTLLTELSLSTNYLTGPFPQTLCFPGYDKFMVNLGFNFLTGTLAYETCQQTLYRRIQYLILQGNFFTGPLHEILDISNVHRLEGLSLSNNELTGTIPSELFPRLPALIVLSLGSNCLSGTLPNEICVASYLWGISVEGGSTSSNCQVPIIDIPSLGMNAFVTRKSITGTIPACLFGLQTIRSIYLSGNRLTGTLPDINSSSLFNASLSYNALTGTIPTSWYGKDLALIDLSYNKLSGTFPENSEISFNQNDINEIISLQVNRLSGTIPTSFNAPSVDVTMLKGNMFSCGWNKRELTQNDPDFATYSCGSNMINNSIYLWLSLSFLVFFLMTLITRKLSRQKQHNRQSSSSMKQFVDLMNDLYTSLLVNNTSSLPEIIIISTSYPSILNFYLFSLHVRRFAVYVLCFILIVLMPVYAILGIYYRTYKESYAWTISGIFLSGTNATITLMIFFVLFIMLGVILVYYLFRKAVREYAARRKHYLNFWPKWRVFALWTVAWLINGFIMITADSLYVYLIIHRSTKYEYLLQITLAMFKLAWHDIGIFTMIHKLKHMIIKKTESEPVETHFLEHDKNGTDMVLLLNPDGSEDQRSLANQPSTFHSSLLTGQEVRYLIYMSIVNKVIIPCLAIFFISSSCFYNALVSPEPQSAYYNMYYDDNIYVNILGSREDDSSFTPAFSYSYQCSSAFLTDYIPVFIFMLLWSSILLPGIVFIMSNLFPNFEEREHEGHLTRILRMTAKSLLPIGWGLINEEELKLRLKNLILHRKQLLTLRISYTFAVMFVFGSLFPPLAFIAAIAIINITMLEEYLTKRMLQQISQPNNDLDALSSDYLEYMEEECRDIDWNWFKVKRLIICLTCWLLGFVLFDVCGDRNGWKEGMIPMVLMIFFPFAFFATMSFWMKNRLSSEHYDSLHYSI